MRFLPTVKAVFLYEYFLLYKRKERLIITFFWPIVNLLIWGYTSMFLSEGNSSLASGLLVGAIVLWLLIFIAQQELSAFVLEKIDNSQLRNFLIAPINEKDYILSVTLVSLVKNIIMFFLLILLAYFLFSFDIFKFGPIMFLLMFNLYFFGWILGLFIISVVLFLGRRASFLSISLAGIIMPFSCIFYPREVLAPFLKIFSWILPSSYIFESLRDIVFNGSFRIKDMIIASSLNVFFFILVLFFFSAMFKLALRKGKLARI